MGGSLSCVNQELDVNELKTLHPVVNDQGTLRTYIRLSKLKDIHKQLSDSGYIEGTVENGKLTTGTAPFNVFARYGSGVMKTHVDQSIIDKYSDRWVVCHNLRENDMNWKDTNNKRVSMCGPNDTGPGHVFITTTNLDWTLFNVLTIVHTGNVDFLLELKEVAELYVKERGLKNYGFYFHCFPHNSVNSLHLHVCNEDNPGHMLEECAYKNLPLDTAIEIAKEIKMYNLNRIRRDFK